MTDIRTLAEGAVAYWEGVRSKGAHHEQFMTYNEPKSYELYVLARAVLRLLEAGDNMRQMIDADLRADMTPQLARTLPDMDEDYRQDVLEGEAYKKVLLARWDAAVRGEEGG